MSSLCLSLYNIRTRAKLLIYKPFEKQRRNFSTKFFVIDLLFFKSGCKGTAFF